jgi:hypothetical protein
MSPTHRAVGAVRRPPFMQTGLLLDLPDQLPLCLAPA